MLKPDCIEYLKTQCNYYENGYCTTRSCFIRGGWDGKPTNKEITPTCIYKEVIKEIGDLKSNISMLEAELETEDY